MVKSLDCCCKILTWCRKDNLLIIRLAQVYVFLNFDFFVKIYTLCYTLMILNINLCLSSSEVFQTANKMKHRDLSKSNIVYVAVLQQCKINLNIVTCTFHARWGHNFNLLSRKIKGIGYPRRVTLSLVSPWKISRGFSSFYLTNKTTLFRRIVRQKGLNIMCWITKPLKGNYLSIWYFAKGEINFHKLCNVDTLYLTGA